MTPDQRAVIRKAVEDIALSAVQLAAIQAGLQAVAKMPSSAGYVGASVKRLDATHVALAKLLEDGDG